MGSIGARWQPGFLIAVRSVALRPTLASGLPLTPWHWRLHVAYRSGHGVALALAERWTFVGPPTCDHRGVLARRLLLFAALLLLASAVAGSLAPEEDDGPATTPAPAAAPSDRVRASLPADEPVVAEVGDVVELTVRADVAERVEIRDLGVDAAVGPDLPATLLLVADRAGRFPVTLRYGGTRVGTLDVRGS